MMEKNISDVDLEILLNDLTLAKEDLVDSYYLILGLVERGNIPAAIEIAEKLIFEGYKYFGFCLADILYDTDCPMENDELWAKNIRISLNEKEVIFASMYDTEYFSRDDHINHCGIFVCGHGNRLKFIDHFHKNFNVTIKNSDLKLGYAIKVGHEFFYSDIDKGNCIPITTTFSETAIVEIRKQYEL